MGTSEKVLVALLATIAFTILIPMLGTLIGAFVGFIVGLFFENTIMGFLSRAGFATDGFAMWQVGAALGFIGAFFRTTVTQNKT